MRGAPVLLHEDRTVIAAGDLDGDRRIELVYGTAGGNLYWIHDGPSRNEARIPAPIMQRPEEIVLGGHSSIAVGDLDADGRSRPRVRRRRGPAVLPGRHGSRRRAPLCAAGRDRGRRGSLPDRAQGPTACFWARRDRSLGHARPTLADWLGHGRPDLIVTGAGGDVLLLPNDGAATEPRFGHPVAIRCEDHPLILPPRVQPAMAPWTDPDGIDLLALDLQGFLCAYPQLDRNEVGRPVFVVDHLGRVIRLDGSFGLSGRCSIWAGPWTAPDRIDLLIGLPRANRHVVPAVTGFPLDDFDALPTVLLLENQGRGVVVPRSLMYRDGSPVVTGQDGCCPVGVPREDADLPDLLVGSDDGSLTWINRENLRW